MADGDELVRDVYDELRKLAQAYLARERPGHTLQPTALVHEVYLPLAKAEAGQGEGWNGRGHFFGAAARARRSRCRTSIASTACPPRRS